jgi:flagellar protein FlaI
MQKRRGKGKKATRSHEKKETTYPLIENFASAKITKSGRSWVYSLIEPKLNDEDTAMLEKIKSHIIEVMDSDRALKERNVKSYLDDQFQEYKTKYKVKMPPKREKLIWYYLIRDFLGLGRIEALMHDKSIEDISCDGVGVHIYVTHKDYGTIKTDVMFTDEHELEDFVIRLSQKCGRFISYGEPLLDGSLSDGSRVQATFGAGVTIRGPTFDIRKFRAIPFTPLDLYQVGTFSFEELAYLWVAIEKRKNVLISGGTASGKSTVLNAISLFIPENLKIVSIEDTAELNLLHENWVQSVSRSGLSAAGENKYGEVSMFDLLKASFRQRPDYVIVGEVRGKEATVMFQGMASGHAGLGTIHAESLAAVIERLSTPPISLPRSLIGILDILIIQVSTPQIHENSRRCKEIIEIIPEKDKIGSKSVFRWDSNKDETYFFSESRILEEGEKISEEELENRVKFLKLMNDKKVGFKEFPVWIHLYQDNPNKAFKLLSMS